MPQPVTTNQVKTNQSEMKQVKTNQNKSERVRTSQDKSERVITSQNKSECQNESKPVNKIKKCRKMYFSPIVLIVKVIKFSA